VQTTAILAVQILPKKPLQFHPTFSVLKTELFEHDTGALEFLIFKGLYSR
jgi:hypothetical protein